MTSRPRLWARFQGREMVLDEALSERIARDRESRC